MLLSWIIWEFRGDFRLARPFFPKYHAANEHTLSDGEWVSSPLFCVPRTLIHPGKPAQAAKPGTLPANHDQRHRRTHRILRERKRN